MEKYPERIPGEEVYTEFCTDFEWWCVFGEQSGHCYGTFSSEYEAWERERELNYKR